MQRPASGPLVSVIVRTMGRPELPRALASVAAQTYRPLEVVLVDAAGSGMAMLPAGDVPVRAVLKGRLERAQAANAGLEGARGEWLLFLDEDDVVEPEHIEQLVAAAAGSGNEVAYSQTRLVDDAGRTQRIFGGPYNRAFLFRSNYLAIHAVLFSRRVVDAGHRFDETMTIFEDWDFWLQLSQRAPFAFTGKPTAVYHATVGQSSAGAGGNLDRDLLVAQRMRLMDKWRDAKR